MNSKQAEAKGFGFTGIYNFDKSKTKARLEEIRKAGFKAYLVTVPHSKLSRGGGGEGYSVYAEQRYFDEKERESIKQQLNVGIPSQREYLKIEHERQLSELEAKEKQLLERLAELESKFIQDLAKKVIG